MNENIHGRRYSFTEKREILKFLEKHTYKDTSEKFSISETTLSRWRKEIKSENKKNRIKIIISLPKFWLESLNEEIELDVWDNYSDAILSIIRDYFKNQNSVKQADSKYLENVKELIPDLIKLNPNIESILLTSSNEVVYKSEGWVSTEGISNLIENWKKLMENWKSAHWLNKDISRKFEFEFQNETYYIRDMSTKHLVGVRKERYHDIDIKVESSYLLGLKRKLTENDVFIFAMGKETENSSLLLAMNTLKRTAMGALPTIKKKNNENSSNKSPKIPPRNEKMNSNESFQIKTDLNLKRLATQVNMPLKLEEREALDALEKDLGKNIERITADLEELTDKSELVYSWNKSSEKLAWLSPDMNFPAHKFPCHYLALNGKIILMTLVNLGLSEIPSEISKFQNLTYLCLNLNKITQFPHIFSNTKALEVLYLDSNQFTKVPESIITLPKLQFLSMQKNEISQIPVTLTERYDKYLFKYLGSHIMRDTYLNFSGNKITHDSLTKEQQELESIIILVI